MNTIFTDEDRDLRIADLRAFLSLVRHEEKKQKTILASSGDRVQAEAMLAVFQAGVDAVSRDLEIAEFSANLEAAWASCDLSPTLVR